jgi:hypothetical protein
MSAEELAAWVAESRARQGLPPTITDPSILATVATLLDTPAGAGPPERDDAPARTRPRRRTDRPATVTRTEGSPHGTP